MKAPRRGSVLTVVQGVQWGVTAPRGRSGETVERGDRVSVRGGVVGGDRLGVRG
jgi:hypothetical protein